VPGYIVHWDDIESAYVEAGRIGSTWTPLSRAAGSRSIRVNRIRVAAGRRSTPLHSESDEEIFYVVGGSGLSWQRAAGAEDETFEIRAGDCLVHRAEREAHTLVAGDDGLDVIAFATGPENVYAYFPRLDMIRSGPTLLAVDDRRQWDLEAALPDPDLPPPSARPSRIVNGEEVELESHEHGDVAETWRPVGIAAGSVLAGLRRIVVPPGKVNCPPHCHSAEEELFVILDGEGSCVLGREEHPVRAGHVIARPPGTRVAHSFRGGEADLTLLAYGTREPNDIAYYPRSNKVYFRGVGLMTRLEKLDYWDGEPE
jgi:uncharacterized cupin superfamily protein